MKLPDDDVVRYYAFIDDTAGGPYTVEALESLVYLKKITPDTPIARLGAAAYTSVRESELAAVLFPHLPSTQTSDPVTWSPPGRENEHVHRKRFRMSAAKFENLNAQTANQPKVDVYAMLDEIRESEKASGFDLPQKHRFRISKRSIDFWIVCITGNAFILGCAVAMQNTASIVFGIAGSGLFTFGLLWSLYGVMDRY